MKTFRIVTIGLLVMLGSAPRVTAPAAADLPRVRSTSPRLAAIIEDARGRSQTFRELVEAINTSDGVVYVQEGRCGHGVRACFTSVTVAGPNRFLWIRIDTDRVDWNADCDVMGVIGHELRHALEVLDDRTVRDDITKHRFYALNPASRARGYPDAFETEAAIVAGLAVRTEAQGHPSRAKEP